MTNTNARIPARSEVAKSDCWDLSTLFADDAAWQVACTEWSERLAGYARYSGRLGESAAVLAEAIEFDLAVTRLGDRVQTYAGLRESEDTADQAAQAMRGRADAVAGRMAEAASFLQPELLAIPEERYTALLAAPELAAHRLTLERLARYRPHTLSAREERLLAMQAESAQAARNIFQQLNNADLKFGDVEIEPGRKVPLSHGSFITFLHQPDRAVRRRAFAQYYAEFADHANTLAATLSGSVLRDVYEARVRNYPSAREAALFPDRVPTVVYDNLIAAVRAGLPAVHRYLDVRRRGLGLGDLHAYDTYVPLVLDFEASRSWDEAVALTLEAVKPLGPEYGAVLAEGLRGRWCDRYENRGKRSGAFSSGMYDSDPFILMNYQAEAIDHVFTLAHEAGHSMHSHYSNRAQPYQYSGYTIFVAEVASTLNEQLLSRLLMDRATTDRERAYYVNREIDAVRATLIRQTMFAEFEAMIHAQAERGEPLTLEFFRSSYRQLLEAYFGPDFVIDDELTLECLRIPHFYRAFYVYKYATGLAAATALAERILAGETGALDAYLGFLRGGCSRDPLDLLRDAGVDLETPEPVGRCLGKFAQLVETLDRLVGSR